MTYIFSINPQLPYEEDTIIVPTYTDEEMEIQSNSTSNDRAGTWNLVSISKSR